MQDLSLWALLQGEELDPFLVLPHLDFLATQPLAQRMPFWGMLSRCLTDPYPGLREAGLRVLAGAHGYAAWTQMIAALDDDLPRVRRAAVEALCVSCVREPGRWLHVLAHHDADVRRWGLESLPEGFPRHWLLPWVMDDANQAQVLSLLEPFPYHPQTILWLLDFLAEGILVPAQVRSLFVDMPWDRKCDEILTTLGRTKIMPEALPLELHALEDFLSSPRTRNPGLDQVMGALWQEYEEAEFQEAGEEPLCADLVVEKLLSGIQRGRLSVDAHIEMAISVARVAFLWWNWQPRPLTLASAVFPCLLAHPQIEVSLRKQAAIALAHHPVRFRFQTPVLELFDGAVCLTPTGQPDLTVLAALLPLIEEEPFSALVQHFGEERLVEAMQSQVEGASLLLALSVPQMPSRGVQCRLLQRYLSTADDDTSFAKIAALLPKLPLSLLESCAFTQQMTDLAFVEVGLCLTGALGKTDDGEHTRVAVSVARTLPPAFLYWWEMELRTWATTATISTEQVLHFLARLSETSTFLEQPQGRVLCLTLLQQLQELPEQAFVLWPEQSFVRLALFASRVDELPLTVMQALFTAAAAFPQTPWLLSFSRSLDASARVGVTPVYQTRTPVYLSDEQRRVWRELPPEVLRQACVFCYQQPTRGLASVILERGPFTLPEPELCVALLASADPAPLVARAFVRVEAQTPAFLHALELLLVRRCERRLPLSLLGHTMLWRWQQHRAAIEEAFDQDFEGQLSRWLDYALSLPSVTLASSVWKAAIRLLGLWKHHEPTRLACVDWPELCVLLLDVFRRVSTRTNAADTSALYASLRPLAVALIEQIASFCAVDEPLVSSWLDELQRRIRREQAQLDQQSLVLLSQRWPQLMASTTQLLVSHEQMHRAVQSASAEKFDQASSSARLLLARSLDPEASEDEVRTALEALFSNSLDDGDTALAAFDAAVQDSAPHASLCKAWLVAAVTEPDAGHLQNWLLSVLEEQPWEAEFRFSLALALMRAGVTRAEALVVAMLCDASPLVWFGGEAWKLLQESIQNNERNAASMAAALVSSPHVAVYGRALDQLYAVLGTGNETGRDVAILGLRRFLREGPQRDRTAHLRVAVTLAECGDAAGVPTLVQAYLPAEHAAKGPSFERLRTMARQLLFQVCASETLLRVTEALLWAGPDVADLRAYIGRLLHHLESAPETLEAHGLLVLQQANDAAVQRQVLAKLPFSSARTHTLRRVATAFAWGVRRARQLTGKLFTIQMIGGEALGYTRLHEPRIFINPLPLLRKERGGDRLVKALILHELGHHIYHATQEAHGVWKQAKAEKIHALLNFVSDEHLERNLRALEPEAGHMLKQLSAYAFQHNQREIDTESLLRHLGIHAFSVLRSVRIQVSRRPSALKLNVGKIFVELEAAGRSFARFVRALRMGLGNRHGDPQVARALSFFRKGKFRHSSMSEMLELAHQLEALFGREQTAMLEVLSQDLALEAHPSEMVELTEDVSNTELQREIERVLNQRHDEPQESLELPHAIRTIRLGPMLDFPMLSMVLPLAKDSAKERRAKQSVRRWSQRMRHFLHGLGLGMQVQSGRVRGQRLDRSRLQSVILRGDPRMLIARKTVLKSDLFLGVLVDCSESMRLNENIKKAQAFAMMLAEAARGFKDIDMRCFGFNDEVLFDAGDATQCTAYALNTGGGNNDAGALWHLAKLAMASRRKAKLLVMISDGSPTECSVASLEALVRRLVDRMGIACAQVAVRPMEHVCFPHFVNLSDYNFEQSVYQFGETIARLVQRTIQQGGV